MASKVPDEPPCNTQEAVEETIAFRKKRSRRVSFADREITSVHIFNRDDDYETPPDSTPRSTSEREKAALAVFKDLVDSEEDEDEEDEVLRARKSFLRPMESPSPGGSSTVGSATSNDEDNFFGPVSANFIRPGRFSDSAASDDNHDITMDSTAFSMHFRSIARSESGDLTTSTRVPLASEENTPSQATMSSDPESFMVLTKVKKLKSPSSVPINKFSGCRDSNDMSLIGESMHRFDYGTLSPTLEALLADGGEEFNSIPVSDSTPPKLSMSAICHDNGNSCIEPSHCENSELCNSNNHDTPGKGISIAKNKPAEVKGDSTNALIDQTMGDCFFITKDGPVAEYFADHQIQTPNQLKKGNKGISEVVSGTSGLNSEFLAGPTVTPLNQSTKAFQLDLFKQSEYGNQPPTKDGFKKNSPQYKRYTSDVDHASIQRDEPSSAGSIHSLSAKRQQILLDTTNSPRRALFITASPKQSGSVLSKGSIKQGGSVPSILKSNSKFKIREPSPCASAFSDGAIKSKSRLLEFPSSKACSYNMILEELNEGLQHQQATDPVNNLEEQLSGVGLKQGEMGCNGLGTPKNISSLSQDGGTPGLAKDKDKSTELMTKSNSPSKFAFSRKETKHHSLASVDSLDGTLVMSTFNSSPEEITLEISKDKRDTNAPYKLVSPLVNRLNEKLSPPTGHPASLSGNLKLLDQDNSTIFVTRQECNSVEPVRSNSLTATAENGTQSGSPLVKVNRLKDSPLVKRVDEGENNGLDLQNTPETSRSFSDGIALKLQSGSPGESILTAIEIAGSSEKFEEQVKVSSAHASPDAHRTKNNLSPQKSPSKKKHTWSPTSKEPSKSSCRKEMRNALHDDNMQLSVAKDAVSLSCSSTVQSIDDLHRRSAKNSSPVEDGQNSSKRKRTSEELAVVDVHHRDKNDRIRQSPKFHMEHIENERIKGGKRSMNWTDIFLKLLTDTNLLLSPCFDRLPIKLINKLEYVLLHQHKVNLFDMLCSEIHSQLCSLTSLVYCCQQTYHQSGNIQHKRIAETRSLVCRIVHEKAKLQLMHVKRERLLKQVDLLRTRVCESQMLKLNCVKHLSFSAEKDTQFGSNSRSVTFGDCLEGASEKVTKMKHESEALEKKIKHLTKSFHIHCKIKGEPNCYDTIEFVNDHLKKRNYCRLIRRDIQLWQVDDLQNRNGHHNVVLSYNGLIYQSLTLNTGPNPSICVANRLNYMNFSKNFPNMDACAAFAFVFNHEPTKKYAGPKSLAQVTQRTSSLLGNLLDVVEEVQIAQLEIRNMTLSSFQSPSAEQLHLQLAFFDFDSGAKVMMTLDMTCLNSGVYPSEIQPYHLETSSTGIKHLECRPLSAEIKAAVGNLRAGYSRIIRLCRCASQVVQSLGR